MYHHRFSAPLPVILRSRSLLTDGLHRSLLNYVSQCLGSVGIIHSRESTCPMQPSRNLQAEREAADGLGLLARPGSWGIERCFEEQENEVSWDFYMINQAGCGSVRTTVASRTTSVCQSKLISAGLLTSSPYVKGDTFLLATMLETCAFQIYQLTVFIAMYGFLAEYVVGTKPLLRQLSKNHFLSKFGASGSVPAKCE
ncbi:hypothetical protein M440DRAFT_281857 [Trichoderma longibrachiatum ATCC 18648]|uniref:Uncharacterized protein n=1 Tax=Trichoderma longibrachiatum ATCC 18648 TaxID=983965 RepID=A0A2T4C7H2_TRILO|nr:hypothetical protein M440DRAFT_281857 [Trichoderma longibrachiatum ATCC 18648]